MDRERVEWYAGKICDIYCTDKYTLLTSGQRDALVLLLNMLKELQEDTGIEEYGEIIKTFQRINSMCDGFFKEDYQECKGKEGLNGMA